jgi:hypothetical protein
MDGQVLTRMRFRIAVWFDARSMPFRIRRDQTLHSVLAFANRPRANAYSGLPADYILKHVVAVTRRPWMMRDRRCLRQALLGFRFLVAAGHEAELHFGIDRASLPGPQVRAHCWIVCRGKVVLNPPDPNTVSVLIHRPDASDGIVSADLAAAAFH